jgi:inner membrane protein
MPLPVAHVVVGACVAEALLPSDTPRRNRTVLLLGCLALVPDLDFIPVWLLGLDRGSWHRGFTHSVVFAVLAGCLLGIAFGRRRIGMAAICALVLMSHGMLDALTTISGGGVQLLWPFSSARLKSGLFELWEPAPATAVATPFVMQLLRGSAVELLTFLPLGLLVILGVRKLRAIPWWRSGQPRPVAVSILRSSGEQ